MKRYNGLNSVNIGPHEAFGLCGKCGRRLTAETCDHPTTMETEEWRAVNFAAEQSLANDAWDARHNDEQARQAAELADQEAWLQTAIAYGDADLPKIVDGVSSPEWFDNIEEVKF